MRSLHSFIAALHSGGDGAIKKKKFDSKITHAQT